MSHKFLRLEGPGRPFVRLNLSFCLPKVVVRTCQRDPLPPWVPGDSDPCPATLGEQLGERRQAARLPATRTQENSALFPDPSVWDVCKGGTGDKAAGEVIYLIYIVYSHLKISGLTIRTLKNMNSRRLTLTRNLRAKCPLGGLLLKSMCKCSCI